MIHNLYHDHLPPSNCPSACGGGKGWSRHWLLPLPSAPWLTPGASHLTSGPRDTSRFKIRLTHRCSSCSLGDKLTQEISFIGKGCWHKNAGCCLSKSPPVFKQTTQRGSQSKTWQLEPSSLGLILANWFWFVCFDKGKVTIKHSVSSQVPWMSEISIFTLMVLGKKGNWLSPSQKQAMNMRIKSDETFGWLHNV